MAKKDFDIVINVDEFDTNIGAMDNCLIENLEPVTEGMVTSRQRGTNKKISPARRLWKMYTDSSFIQGTCTGYLSSLMAALTIYLGVCA